MKELLEQLGFVENNIEFEKEEKRVYLPMLSAFVKAINGVDHIELENGSISKEAIKIYLEALFNIDKYTYFITRPLTKGMFIPCDDNGEVLEKPNRLTDISMRKRKEYQQAEEQVLFDVSTLDKYGSSLLNIGTIEQAINNGVKLYLK